MILILLPGKSPWQLPDDRTPFPRTGHRSIVADRIEIPAEFLSYASRGADWVTYLDRLPGLVLDIVDDWRLRVDGPATYGHASLVVPVRTPEDQPAMVKFGFPHAEAEHEQLALREWRGNGAVRLLRADPTRWVLLLERAQPRDLTTVEVLTACRVVAEAYPRLHLPAIPQLRRLSAISEGWSRRLSALPHQSPIPKRYVEQAISLARDFASDENTDGRIIHTDLHYANVLASARFEPEQSEPAASEPAASEPEQSEPAASEPAASEWLVIDPKPVSGDPHFEVAPLLWNRWAEVLAGGDARAAIRQRFHTVLEVAGFDEDRTRDWVTVFEIVNAMWTLEDLAVAGRPVRQLTSEDRDWITRCITIAKAVQE